MEYSFDQLPVWIGSARESALFSASFESNYKIYEVNHRMGTILLKSKNGRISLHIDIRYKTFSYFVDRMSDIVEGSFNSLLDFVEMKELHDNNLLS